jgi:TPR repeat protein
MRLLFLCLLTITSLTASAADSLADYQEKAAQGDPAAQLELGTKYLFGEGVAKDPGMALKWLQQAAEYGDKNPSWFLRSGAFAALGIAYENSGGVKNIEQAVKWYTKSAMLNDPRGMAGLSRIYSDGEGVPKDVVAGLAWMYVAAGSGAPGTVDNHGVELAISHLENEAGADGVALARKKCSELTAKIKASMVSP